jgi:hypothetical protein
MGRAGQRMETGSRLARPENSPAGPALTARHRRRHGSPAPSTDPRRRTPEASDSAPTLVIADVPPVSPGIPAAAHVSTRRELGENGNEASQHRGARSDGSTGALAGGGAAASTLPRALYAVEGQTGVELVATISRPSRPRPGPPFAGPGQRFEPLRRFRSGRPPPPRPAWTAANCLPAGEARRRVRARRSRPAWRPSRRPGTSRRD